MGNMQILPIMAKTNNIWRFNTNMQYPHIKALPFVIEMIFFLKKNCFFWIIFLISCTFISCYEFLKSFFFIINFFLFFKIFKKFKTIFVILFIIKYAYFMPNIWVLCETKKNLTNILCFKWEYDTILFYFFF